MITANTSVLVIMIYWQSLLPSLVISHLCLACFFGLLDGSLHASRGVWHAVATTAPLHPKVGTRTGVPQGSCISPIFLFNLFVSSYRQDDHLMLAYAKDLTESINSHYITVIQPGLGKFLSKRNEFQVPVPGKKKELVPRNSFRFQKRNLELQVPSSFCLEIWN